MVVERSRDMEVRPLRGADVRQRRLDGVVCPEHVNRDDRLERVRR